MIRFRPIYFCCLRKTSHVQRIPRYEAEVLKRIYPGHEHKIESIPASRLKAKEWIEVENAEAAFHALVGKYGQRAHEVYPTLAQFEKVFNATLERDGEGAAPPPETEDWKILLSIPEVGEDLAKALFQAGFNSPEAVALAELDDLEAVTGVGPHNSTVLKGAAIELLQGADPETGVEDSGQEDDTPDE